MAETTTTHTAADDANPQSAESTSTHTDSHTTGAAAGAHGAGPEGHHAPEVPSVLDLVSTFKFAQQEYTFEKVALDPKTGHTVKIPVASFTVGKAIKAGQNQFFALFMVAVVLAVLARKLARPSLRHPGRFQMTIEVIAGALRDLVYGVLGEKNGKRYLPYLGSLFLFILLCNLMGLVPFLRSPTSVYQTTFALGLCTFLYVQFSALRFTGPLRYLYHLMGEPKGDSLFISAFMWLLGIFLLLPLHLLGELIKPISLSLRLFGNILGEDILLGVFTVLGLSIMAAIGWDPLMVEVAGESLPIVGIPLQLPFFFLALLTSTIQALVFALLSMVYFLMVLPHVEEAH